MFIQKRLRNEIQSSLPKHQDIQAKGLFNLTFDLKNVFELEEENFDRLVADNNIQGLLTRYPIRETQILNRIVSNLGLTSDQYESIVRKLIVDESEIKGFYKILLQPLTNLID